MSSDSDVEAVLDLVAKRIDVLRLLDDERVPKRTIAEELDYSRSTVNRTITALTDAGLVDDAPGGCQATVVGSLLAEQYDAYVRGVADVLTHRQLLASFPLDAEFSPKVLADAEVSVPRGSSPYEPYHAIEALLERASGQVRVYVPTFTNPRGIELATRLSAEFDVEIIFDRELVRELRSDIPDEVETLSQLEKFTGYETTDGPDYSLIVVDTESGAEGAVIVHSTERELLGCIVTGAPDATRWLEQRYSDIRAESERLDTLP